MEARLFLWTVFDCLLTLTSANLIEVPNPDFLVTIHLPQKRKECMGSVLSPSWVLAGGMMSKCLDGKRPQDLTDPSRLFMMALDLSQTRKVASIAPAPDYGDLEFYPDMCLLRAREKFLFTASLQPIAINSGSLVHSCQVFTWGIYRHNGAVTQDLQMEEVKPYPYELCSSEYGVVTEYSQMCGHVTNGMPVQHDILTRRRQLQMETPQDYEEDTMQQNATDQKRRKRRQSDDGQMENKTNEVLPPDFTTTNTTFATLAPNESTTQESTTEEYTSEGFFSTFLPVLSNPPEIHSESTPVSLNTTLEPIPTVDLQNTTLETRPTSVASTNATESWSGSDEGEVGLETDDDEPGQVLTEESVTETTVEPPDVDSPEEPAIDDNNRTDPTHAIEPTQEDTDDSDSDTSTEVYTGWWSEPGAPLLCGKALTGLKHLTTYFNNLTYPGAESRLDVYARLTEFIPWIDSTVHDLVPMMKIDTPYEDELLQGPGLWGMRGGAGLLKGTTKAGEESVKGHWASLLVPAIFMVL